MKNIFDELVENIVVIDEYEKIVLVNQMLYEQMGYTRDELDFDKLDEIITINKDNVILNCKDGTIIKAKCNLIEGEIIKREYKVGVISWEKDRYNGLLQIEKILSSIEYCPLIKINQPENIAINNNVHNKNKKEGMKILENFTKSECIIVKINDKGEFIDVNDGWVKSLGWTREEMRKMNWKDLVHPSDLQESIEFNNNYGKNTIKRRTFVSRHRNSKGAYKWLEWVGKFNKYDKDNGLYFIASARDITLEKDLEEKELLMKKYKELEILRNEFFANLSHELRTPITMIMSIAQILEKNMISENDINELRLKSDKYLGILKQNSYRLLRIINNLIDGTKIDSGFYNINLINTDIIYIVEEIVMSVTEYCKVKNITIIFNTNVEEEIIACDPNQIERIMLNLLSNATKYTQEGGNILVDLQVKNDYIHISVKDSGEGICEEKINYIFDRFVQGNKKDENRVDGSGIGLSLVKSFVEMHGGQLSVESKKGSGSTFMFTLPRIKIDNNEMNDEGRLRYDGSRQERYHIEFSDIY